jgi:hypothetical protein
LQSRLGKRGAFWSSQGPEVVHEVAFDGAEGFREGLEGEEDDRLEGYLGLRVCVGGGGGVAAVVLVLVLVVAGAVIVCIVVRGVFLVVVAGTRTAGTRWA